MNKDEVYINNGIQDNMHCVNQLYSQSENLKDICEVIINCYKKDNKLLIFGNGGSAADSQHIAGELVSRFKLERKGLAAIALTTDTSIMTAYSNDYKFEGVFARQVEALARKEDVLFGLSTSGNSKNVIKAFHEGKKIGTTNISLTGNDGGKIKSMSDLNVNINFNDTARIQEAHMVAYHLICGIVEKKMVDYWAGK